MRYNVNIIERESKNKLLVDAKKINGIKDPVAHMSDLIAMEQRLTKLIISRTAK